MKLWKEAEDVVVGDGSGVEEEEKEEEMHGRLPCPRWSRVHEAAAERTVRATYAFRLDD